MHTMRRTLARINLALFNLAYASQVFAEDQVVPHEHAWPWRHEGHMHTFWWIFPLMFFVFMCVMFIFMIRRGGMACMWRDWMMGGPELRDAIKREPRERSESALEVLDKRYARGEIDKQEYKEKKATIIGS